MDVRWDLSAGSSPTLLRLESWCFQHTSMLELISAAGFLLWSTQENRRIELLQHFMTGITEVRSTSRSGSCRTRGGRYSLWKSLLNRYHDGYIRQNTGSFGHQTASQFFCAQPSVRKGFNITSFATSHSFWGLGETFPIISMSHMWQLHSLHDSTNTKAAGRSSHSSVAANVSRIYQIFVKDNDLSVGATDFFSVT